MTRDLTDNARQEVAYLTRFAADTQHSPAERAAALLTAHQRWDVGGCLCGWSQLGMSHALHQADVLANEGLLAARVDRLASGMEWVLPADVHSRWASMHVEGCRCIDASSISGPVIDDPRCEPGITTHPERAGGTEGA